MKCYNKAYVFIHYNRMLAKRAFYCTIGTINTGFQWENGEADT